MELKTYPDRTLDSDFLDLVKSKINELQSKYDNNVLSRISLKEVELRTGVINGKKPKSKFRNHKRQILHYLDYHISENSTELGPKSFLSIKETYLTHSNSLMEEVGFRYKGLWVIYCVIGLLIDLILIYSGFADLYYNIPIMFLYFFISGIYKDYKAKKENKLFALQTEE